MILVDTSVWVDFFRSGDDLLATLLEEGQVLTHPYIVGELACVNLPSRSQVLADLTALPSAPVAQHPEVLLFIEQHALMGADVGYLDIHLLASVRLGADLQLWTRDKKLAALADRFNVIH